ncbi:MAG: peptide transporter substrate-binding protein, partial [Cryobacterium sp.]|nr:peptide transporter substrate-binding protein [Cryobacterium sp.]
MHRNHPVRTGLTATAILSTAVLALSACAPAATESAGDEPVSGGTLTYASGDAEPTCLDPHVGGNYP